MPTCPKCKQPVDSQAIACPKCNNQLKAFGHPGMPLYQSEDDTSLCDRCTYDRDDSCNFPQRPHAKSCTLFHDATTPLVSEAVVREITGRSSARIKFALTPTKSTQGWTGIKNLLYRYRAIVAIALLVLVSIWIAL